MQQEVHLFILWEKARIKEEKIIEDISCNFEILRIFEIEWSKENFSKNLSRFYGENLPKNSNKEKHCGNGAFLVIVVKDNNPLYRIRKTSKGITCVNTNIFDSKEMYRFWTGGGHKIHGTNSIAEANHDLVLLLGVNVEDFKAKLKRTNYKKSNNKNVIKFMDDVTGSNGWESIHHLFYVLNASTKYLVLRNFECLPDKYNMENHGDIDLLVENYNNIKHITNSKEVFKSKFRVQNIVKIRGESLLFDYRFIGDDYFDSNWQKRMLANRIFDRRGFFRVNDEDYFYSLLYHAFIHKSEISFDYKLRLSKLLKNINLSRINKRDIHDEKTLFETLLKYLKKNNFEMKEPRDFSVFFNPFYTKKKMSKRKFFLKAMNRLNRALKRCGVGNYN